MEAFGALALRAVDEGYPLIVHIPHSLFSVAKYRQWRASEGLPQQWLYDMFVSMYTHSQGGGVASQMLLLGDNPVHYLAKRWDYLWVQVLSYLANYWSPGDIVGRTLGSHRNPLRLFCLSMDSFDAITTVCGLADAARGKYPDNKLLPTLQAIVLFNGGGFWKLLDARARGQSGKSFLANPGQGITRAVFWSLLYQFFGYHFQQGKHRNKAVVHLTAMFVAMDLIEDQFSVDLFAHVHKPVVAAFSGLRQILCLGPPSKMPK